MYQIALQMLLGDRSKYLAMIVGVCFASLIMTQQPAILLGLLTRTYSFIKDTPAPDIWVMDPGVQFVEENKPFRSINLNTVKSVEGVAWAVPMYKTMTAAKIPDGSMVNVDMTGIDDATLIGAPSHLLDGTTLADLKKPDAIFVDKVTAETRLRIKLPDGKTRPLMIGDALEINDKRALVAGYYKATRNFILQPQICTFYSRAQRFAPPKRRDMSYILVHSKEGYDSQKVANDIARKTGLKAIPADPFCDLNLQYWMKNTGIPINFGISVLLGFIVGAAIVGQTFFNFVQENMTHYAALKAMGISNKLLTRMVLLQAFFIGFVGYGFGVGITTLFGLKVHDSVLAFRLAPSLLLFSFMGVFLIISLAAFISIRKVIKIDPSAVFRT